MSTEKVVVGAVIGATIGGAIAGTFGALIGASSGAEIKGALDMDQQEPGEVSKHLTEEAAPE